MRKVSRNYRIDADLIERFEKTAEYAKVDKTSVVVEAIRQFVIEQEEKMKNEEIMYALFEITSMKMEVTPAVIRDEFVYGYDIIEGTEEEILSQAESQNAKYIHFYKPIEDDFDNVNYHYVSTIGNPSFIVKEW